MKGIKIVKVMQAVIKQLASSKNGIAVPRGCDAHRALLTLEELGLVCISVQKTTDQEITARMRNWIFAEDAGRYSDTFYSVTGPFSRSMMNLEPTAPPLPKTVKNRRTKV